MVTANYSAADLVRAKKMLARSKKFLAACANPVIHSGMEWLMTPERNEANRKHYIAEIAELEAVLAAN